MVPDSAGHESRRCLPHHGAGPQGQGLTEADVSLMKEHGVPDWYIESCNKISYMFPKAHAVAYVTMAFRIAYFKVHYPLAYYATLFSIKRETSMPRLWPEVQAE